jgi:hypothetical protein
LWSRTGVHPGRRFDRRLGRNIRVVLELGLRGRFRYRLWCRSVVPCRFLLWHSCIQTRRVGSCSLLLEVFHELEVVYPCTSYDSIRTAVLALSRLDAVQGAVRSRVYCTSRDSEGSLVVLVRLLLPLLVLHVPFLLSRGRYNRRKWCGLFRFAFLCLCGFVRRIEQLLCGGLLAQFIEFAAAQGFLFLSLAFRRLQCLLGFQCGIGQFERRERVVGIQAVGGTRVECITPGYTRLAGVRVDATSAEAAHALAR